ncbi:MAG TPA: exo-alpha-sialidase [Acidobacteriota bacterium]
MPNLATDKAGKIHVVYGKDDDIMYASSSDNGRSFSSPVAIKTLPKLADSHMRGPQISASANGLIVTACTEEGNIFSFTKGDSGDWIQSARVNDVDTAAKENLMSLSSDGQTAFAVWQDNRDKQSRIFGSRSEDGGKTWSKNIMVYASPDGAVCECCKPSVLVKGDHVYVMFRNWINGNRDLYLIESADEGNSFGQAQKLGSGSWAYNACPMDGGGFTVNNNGIVESVWRRKSKIYSAEPGKEEQEIGDGRSCTMESVNNKNVYTWVEDGDIVVIKPRGTKNNLGAGSMPVLKAVNNEHVICVWENNEKIFARVLAL